MIELIYRKADINDLNLYYEWANDELVRENSFNQHQISFADHVKWFTNKLESPDCNFFVFNTTDNVPVGQVRIDKYDDEIIIGLSIDPKFRGMSLGSVMLIMACDAYFKQYLKETIVAYIKENNTPSYKIFIKAGFKYVSKFMYHNNVTMRLTKQHV